MKVVNLKQAILQAWKERWSDYQWAINMKRFFPRGATWDILNLAGPGAGGAAASGACLGGVPPLPPRTPLGVRGLGVGPHPRAGPCWRHCSRPPGLLPAPICELFFPRPLSRPFVSSPAKLCARRVTRFKDLPAFMAIIETCCWVLCFLFPCAGSVCLQARDIQTQSAAGGSQWGI